MNFEEAYAATWATLAKAEGHVKSHPCPPPRQQAAGEARRDEICQVLADHGPMLVGQITTYMGVTQQAVSYHLPFLRYAERVDYDMVSGRRVYRVIGQQSQ